MGMLPWRFKVLRATLRALPVIPLRVARGETIATIRTAAFLEATADLYLDKVRDATKRPPRGAIVKQIDREPPNDDWSDWPFSRN